MKIFFIIVAVIVVLMLLFGRRAWDTMNEEQKHEVNNLYSGGLYSKEEMAEKEHGKEKEQRLQPIYDSDGTISSWYIDDDE